MVLSEAKELLMAALADHEQDNHYGENGHRDQNFFEDLSGLSRNHLIVLAKIATSQCQDQEFSALPEENQKSLLLTRNLLMTMLTPGEQNQVRDEN